MGARGKVQQYSRPILVRFSPRTDAQLRIRAAIEGVPIANLIRHYVQAALEGTGHAEEATHQ